jgi:hypothetical protein
MKTHLNVKIHPLPVKCSNSATNDDIVLAIPIACAERCASKGARSMYVFNEPLEAIQKRAFGLPSDQISSLSLGQEELLSPLSLT